MKSVVVSGGRLHPVGGIETHLLHFCEALAARGVAVSLVIASRDYAPGSIKRLGGAGVSVWEYRCGYSWAGAIGYLMLLWRLVRLADRSTVFYSNGTSGFLRLASLFLRSEQWVHHHHGDVTADLLRDFGSLYRAVLKRCEWLIACTPEHADCLDVNCFRGNRTRFLPVITDEPEQPRRIPTRAPGEPQVVGFFGRLRASKGIPTLIEMAPWFQAHGFECRLHGDDCEGLLPDRMPVGVTWKGPYDSGRDLDRLMADVDILVLPTTFPEGLPAVISEAMCRGIPVVSYDGGGVRDLAGFHDGVAVIPPDRDILKATLLKMRDRAVDPTLSIELAAAYRRLLGNEVTLRWWMDLLRQQRSKQADRSQ